jgi:hypothetical protein
MKRNFFKPSTLQPQHTPLPHWRQRFVRIKNRANERPKLSVAILLGAATLNFGLLLLIARNTRQEAFSYSTLHPAGLLKQSRSNAAATMPTIPFTIQNFLQIRAIKDSLALLIGKADRSREDTLLFMRILDQYAQLDTAFARELQDGVRSAKKDAHMKNDTP